VYGGSQQELENLLDFGRVGVEEGGEELEFRGKVIGRVFHSWGCDFLIQIQGLLAVTATGLSRLAADILQGTPLGGGSVGSAASELIPSK